MTKKSEQLTLDELRDKSVKSKTKLSFGKEMGGYNKKQVTEYIDNLTENLHSAEESFNNRLDEYAAMITMLKQERDQYGKMFNICKNSKSEMLVQIDSLKKENEELNQLIKELSVNQNLTQTASFNAEERNAIVESQNKLEEYLGYEQESIELKAQLDQLKSMVRDLNDELQVYVKENLMDYNSGSSADAEKKTDQAVLQSQYSDILSERSSLLNEKNRLMAENNRLAAEVSVLNEQLKTSNAKYNTRIQEITATYESNTDEYINKHQRTLVQLKENMKNSLDLINSESNELSNLMEK